jgi:hypothetical protein
VRSGGRVGGVRSGGADVGRQRDAQGLEQLAGTTGDGGAQDEALAVRRDLDLLETIEVAPDLVPLRLEASGGAAIGELLLDFLSPRARKEQNTWLLSPYIRA